MKEVYIVAATRTPLGSFGGALSSVPAQRLGAIAIAGALEKAGIQPEQVEEVFMGNVCSANLGQAPARQASLLAGIPDSVPCTTVNKVCASGTKAIMLAAQSIMLGYQDIILAGGMENMSMVPYYIPKGRYGYNYGHGQLIDGMLHDGLTDAYSHQLMGGYADQTAKEYHISREEQDAFAIQSYQRSAQSAESGIFQEEIVPVEVPQRKGDPLVVSEDEEYKRVDFKKLPTLRPAFSKDGTVTAANASTINDGAAALVLASGEKVKELGLKPIARIVSFADAAQAPQWFTTSPTKAAPLALQRAGMKLSDIDCFEVNEAFAVVALAFNKILDLDPAKVNILGGAVSLGHPLGASGARIAVTLCNALRQQGGRHGLLSICNGGGGASAMVLEKVS